MVSLAQRPKGWRRGGGRAALVRLGSCGRTRPGHDRSAANGGCGAAVGAGARERARPRDSAATWMAYEGLVAGTLRWRTHLGR